MTEEEKAFLSGFPIEDFGNDKKGVSFLSVSIRNPQYLEYLDSLLPTSGMTKKVDA